MIGAIVLVTAIVVVLPMVLDSEPKPVSQEVTIKIPAPDSGVFTSKVVPLAQPPDTRPAAKLPAESKPAASPPTVGGKPAAPVAAAAAPRPQAEAPAGEAAPGQSRTIQRKEPAQKTTAEPAGRFVVQVIALADAAKAKQMQENIAAAGIQSYTEVVRTAKGDVTRVRAGPFATREAAEKARARLKTLGMNGNVAAK